MKSMIMLKSYAQKNKNDGWNFMIMLTLRSRVFLGGNRNDVKRREKKWKGKERKLILYFVFLSWNERKGNEIMLCSRVGKKRKKKRHNYIYALLDMFILS